MNDFILISPLPSPSSPFVGNKLPSFHLPPVGVIDHSDSTRDKLFRKEREERGGRKEGGIGRGMSRAEDAKVRLWIRDQRKEGRREGGEPISSPRDNLELSIRIGRCSISVVSHFSLLSPSSLSLLILMTVTWQ